MSKRLIPSPASLLPHPALLELLSYSHAFDPCPSSPERQLPANKKPPQRLKHRFEIKQSQIISYPYPSLVVILDHTHLSPSTVPAPYDASSIFSPHVVQAHLFSSPGCHHTTGLCMFPAGKYHVGLERCWIIRVDYEEIAVHES